MSFNYIPKGEKVGNAMSKEDVRHSVYVRSGGRCECSRSTCKHPRVTGGTRCTRTFTEKGNWELHRVNSNLEYTLSNCEALCVDCHKQTASYGRS